jgi:peptide-methionine (R)-S-oxide reductase
MDPRTIPASLLLTASLIVVVLAQAIQPPPGSPEGPAPRPSTEAGEARPDSGMEKVIRTEQEWRKVLTREQYKVLRQKGTERPFRNKYDKHFEPGTYACAACGLELFTSDTKFNSGCGWPAFFAAQAGDRVILQPDYSMGMVRTEVICARCDSHLGHVFADAPQTPTGNRFCINSVSLKFIPSRPAEELEKAPDQNGKAPPAEGSQPRE